MNINNIENQLAVGDYPVLPDLALSKEDRADLLEGYVNAAKLMPIEEKMEGLDYDVMQVLHAMSLDAQNQFTTALNQVYAKLSMENEL